MDKTRKDMLKRLASKVKSANFAVDPQTDSNHEIVLHEHEGGTAMYKAPKHVIEQIHKLMKGAQGGDYPERVNELMDQHFVPIHHQHWINTSGDGWSSGRLGDKGAGVPHGKED